MKETMPYGVRTDSFDGSDVTDERHFTLWEAKLAATDERSPDELLLEQEVLAHPEEPQVVWVESSGAGPTEAEYRQQCYWVIGQFGHMMDAVRPCITTESEAEEWLAMKASILAAKSVVDVYELAGVRQTMIPVWDEYVKRMNFDPAEFERTANR